MGLEEAVKNVVSDYLCPECKGLLYVGIGAREEICSSTSCSRFTKGTVFGSVTESEGLKKELEAKKTQLYAKLMKFHGPSLQLRLAQRRNELIKGLFQGKGLNIKKFFVLNHILIDMNSVHPVGNVANFSDEDELFKEYSKYVDVLNMVDDLENKRYLLRMSDKEVFQIKYWKVLFSAYQNMGITNRALSLERLFKHYDIDKQTKTYIPFRLGIDFTEYFVQFFDFITAIRYALFMHYRTKRQFNYNVTSADIATILGLCFSVLPGENPIWSLASITNHLNKYKQYGLDPKSFVEEYTMSESKSPILVKSDNHFICLKETMLFFLFHLIGLNDSNLNKDKYPSIAQKKEQAAGIFERHVRQLLKDNGYCGPDEPFKTSKKSPEYDILTINETTQNIVLAEAKYWDFSPSSFSGEKLVEQELLEKDRLLEHAIKQQNRLIYFQNNFREFKEKIGIRGSINDYKILTFVITKHIPLIKAYKDVRIVDLDEVKRLLKLN